MDNYDLFVVLDEVESTNNYAMQHAHEGLAIAGQAWFANEQWGGKGQRGKKWVSKKGENIIMSLIVKPSKVFAANPFYLSMLVVNICRQFVADKTNLQTFVKWPNDIYIDDRKAGGILIENIFKGKEWQWAVVGIGINVNQSNFGSIENSAQSLKNATGESYDPVSLAKALQQLLNSELNNIEKEDLKNVMKKCNEHLYKKNSFVSLKKDTAVFKTKILAVNEYGQLLTNDVVERIFSVGEVEWVRD
jgi:BirA family transcriptional regulator, biotin operon repressor / biotin---[acetyl-CoA-carboxylase] ligase